MASPSESEGEIRENTNSKATLQRPSPQNSDVDHQGRTQLSPASSASSLDSRRSRHRSPSRSRSRSPFRHNRSPRGSKRRRDPEDHYRERGYRRDFPDSRPTDLVSKFYPRHGADDRGRRVHYEDEYSPPPSSRERASRYRDGRDGRDGWQKYRDRDGPANRARRDRDAYRVDSRRSRDASMDRHRDRRYSRDRDDDDSYRRRREGSAARPQRGERRSSYSSDRPFPDRTLEGSQKQNSQSKPQNGSSAQSSSPQTDNPAGDKAPEASSTESEGEPVEVPDDAEEIERRRQRRAALKAKYQNQSLANATVLSQAIKTASNAESEPPKSEEAKDAVSRSESSMVTSPETPSQAATPGSPAVLDVKNDEELANRAVADHVMNDADAPSAADYNPMMDMAEDKRHAELKESQPPAEVVETVEATEAVETKKQIKPTDEFDMFAEDVDEDMFAAESPVKITRPQPSGAATGQEAKRLDYSLLDDWDDPDGYYKVILGELLDGRYHIQTNLGRGMFSGVVRATDTETGKLVAIKIIRNKEAMRKAGMKEIELLQKLREADPDDKKHVIRLERFFDHKNHLCMVFENLSLNLREVLKKFGRDVGINLRAVRSYAQQIFLGLSLLRKCNLLHADLKPDNILVNEGRNLLKIADLGSAADASEGEITQYLVSRFYRAPEIILGMKYDFAIDMWSIGCTLYELYTGKILFAGQSNNQQLRCIMECCGKYSLKMLKKGEFSGLHFEDDGTFRSIEKDHTTGRDVVRLLHLPSKPPKDLKARLLPTAKDLNDHEVKELHLFIDLLERCLHLNPEKRCTPIEALRHPFIYRPMPTPFRPTR